MPTKVHYCVFVSTESYENGAQVWNSITKLLWTLLDILVYYFWIFLYTTFEYYFVKPCILLTEFVLLLLYIPYLHFVTSSHTQHLRRGAHEPCHNPVSRGSQPLTWSAAGWKWTSSMGTFMCEAVGFQDYQHIQHCTYSHIQYIPLYIVPIPTFVCQCNNV